MIKTKGENGYALLTVLLIITIFSMVFLAFVGQSFSTSKQNNRVEEESKAVALAEMGVSYYLAAIHNIYNSNRGDVNQQVIDYAETNPGLNTDVYKQKAIDLMESAIKTGLSAYDKEKKVNDKTNGNFLINSIIVTDESNELLEIRFKSTGSEEGTSASLSATVEIALSSLTFPESTPGETGTGVTYDYPKFDQIKKPESPDCTNPSSIGECNEILIDQENLATLTGNNNKDSKKTVYSTAPLIIVGNGNNINQMNFHSDKSFTFGGNLNNVSDLLIEASGLMTLEGQVRANRTTIFAGQDLKANKHFELYEGSQVFVGGSLTMVGNNNDLVVNASTLCVNGDIDGDSNKIKLSVANNGKLYVNGKITVDFEKSNNIFTKMEDQEFLKHCGTEKKSNKPELNWDNNISSRIEYEY